MSLVKNWHRQLVLSRDHFSNYLKQHDEKTVFLQTALSNHYIFIISQLWLTSHLRSTVILLDTGTPGTSREIF